MAKQERVPRVQGTILREDGVEVEVRSPTVWAHIQGREELLGAMTNALEHARVRVTAADARFVALAAHPWVRFGRWLRLLPRDLVALPEVAREAAPAVTVEKGAAVGPTEAAA